MSQKDISPSQGRMRVKSRLSQTATSWVEMEIFMAAHLRIPSVGALAPTLVGVDSDKPRGHKTWA